MPPTRLPTYIIDEIVTKARGNREIINTNNVPSPRGVADLQFDFPSNDDNAVTKRNTVRLFKDDEFRDYFIDYIGCDFLKSILDKILTVASVRFMRVDPVDVTKALEYMVPDISATMQGIVDEKNAGAMDVDDSSDYEDSDDEVSADDDDTYSTDGARTFDEIYPPVDGIVASDLQFKDEVMMPIFRENFPNACNPFHRKGLVTAGLVKNAMFAYLVGKIKDTYLILDQLEEASSLLEMALWKAKIEETATKNGITEGEKAQCRMTCSAHIVVPLVLPFLFADVTTYQDRATRFMQLFTEDEEDSD